jgi:Protein of unknown function (DUF2934)
MVVVVDPRRTVGASVPRDASHFLLKQLLRWPKRPIGRTIIYYQLYKARGRADGHELEDWLQAEVELPQKSRTVAA